MPALPVRGLIVVSRITKTKRVGPNQSQSTNQNSDTANIQTPFDDFNHLKKFNIMNEVVFYKFVDESSYYLFTLMLYSS